MPSTPSSKANCHKPLIFLDIDGVLNPHNYIDGDVKSTVIQQDNVRVLNEILRRADAEIVLSSAWRYMIPDAVTLKGFEYLLRSHGVAADQRLIGYTCRDKAVPKRGDQIARWLWTNGSRPYVVIDDGGRDRETGKWNDMGMTAAKHPVVWTDGAKGLQDFHVDIVVGILETQKFQNCT